MRDTLALHSRLALSAAHAALTTNLMLRPCLPLKTCDIPLFPCRYQVMEPPSGGCHFDLKLEGWLVVILLLLLFWCDHVLFQPQML